MELYTLDSLWRRTEVIDKFESLIWTERFNAFGDFELVTYSTRANRNLLKTGTYLALNDSYRIMKIETFENSTDADGRALITVKGRSMEMLLEDRILAISPSHPEAYTSTKVVMTYPPMEMAQVIWFRAFLFASHDENDYVAINTDNTIFPEDTIVPLADPVTMEFEFGSAYSGMKKLCDMYGLGFRFVRHPETNLLHFHIYTGSDRTTSQTVLPAVVFSPDMDNLQNTTEFESIAGAKNVAYVMSPIGRKTVYGDNVPEDISGYDRKTMYVNAQDVQHPTGEGAVNLTPEEIDAILTQRGKEALAEHRAFSAFDGEIDPSSDYKYGVHYHLGDLVEMRNVDGVTNQMRVTEQIFVSDREGERSYPTLAINMFIESGSWLSWEQNRVWADMGLTEYWEDLP